MATVDKPRYGVKVTYTNGSGTTFWFQTEAARDRKHAQLNRDKSVKTAKRVSR
jgi:hypothetical protein